MRIPFCVETVMAVYMKSCALLLFVFGACVYADDAPCEYPVNTESGIVCGVKKKASNGDEFVSFLGIPYARAPIGELRFAEPQSPKPFNGTFDATRPGPVCPQSVSEFGTRVDPETMSEDCLRINVHVPLSSLPDSKGGFRPLVPIFAYVHGGSFATGSGNPDVYGAEYLLSKGIMLVTFNYRLNAIGFLSLASKYVPGNAGLRDGVFALKWIHRNILNFGGDPDEVTIGGQSAGGAMAHLLAISPATKDQGLIKRVLVMSGNAISNFYGATPVAAKLYSTLFLRGMNISLFQSSKSIHQKLINAPMEDILKATEYLTSKTLSLNLCPVIENPYDGFTTVVPEDPEDLVKDGYGSDYTTLFGFTNNECQVYRKGLERSNIEKTFRTIPALTVPLHLLFSSNIVTIPFLILKISNEYFNNSAPTIDKFMSLCVDGFYKYPVMRLVDKRLETGSRPTYVYEFSYEGRKSLLKTLLQANWTGAAHSEDITYFFRTNALLGPMEVDELAQPDPDSMMRNWMTTFVANFVKTGVPASDPEAWPTVGSNFWHQSIAVPGKYKYEPATPYMLDKKKFFDGLYRIGRVELLG